MRFRESKYGNVPLRCHKDLFHHSKVEAKRCNDLHMLQKGRLIRDLEAHPQPRFDLVVNDVKVCSYLADFRYFDIQRDCEVVEDVKGVATEVYKLKKKLMLACLGIEVEEVRR